MTATVARVADPQFYFRVVLLIQSLELLIICIYLYDVRHHMVYSRNTKRNYVETLLVACLRAIHFCRILDKALLALIGLLAAEEVGKM